MVKNIYSLILVFIFVGCATISTQKKQFSIIDKKVQEKDFKAANNLLLESKKKYYSKKDAVLFYLDLGLLYHYAKEYEKSNEMLTNAENLIDELYTQSISKSVMSFLLNDNITDYEGEDYENIYLNVFKALNYIGLNQTDKAFVEVRKINEKLLLLESKYGKIADEYNSSDKKIKNIENKKLEFQNSALARYMSFLLYKNENDFDNANIDMQKIDEAFLQSKIYDFAKPNLENIPKNNKVTFISFIGKSPEKFANEFILHSENNTIFIYSSDGKNEKQIDAINWIGIENGLHIKFSLPYIKKKGTKINAIEIMIDKKSFGNFESIESIENVAYETYKLKEPIIYTKAIARSITKAIANAAINKELDKKIGDNALLKSLSHIATGATIDATENADMRISRYFPSRVLVKEIELENGNHNVKINYRDANGQIIFKDNIGNVNIDKNSFNLFSTFCLE